MASAISGLNSTTPATGSTPNALNQLSGGDFIKVMLAQLQQQDPLNPSDSNQLLTQMSQIEQLQSSSNLNTTLQGLSLQQSIGAGSGMMGKMVQGLADDGTQIKGAVTSVKVQNQQVILGLDNGQTLPLTSVTDILPAPVTPTTSATLGTPISSAANSAPLPLSPAQIVSAVPMVAALAK